MSELTVRYDLGAAETDAAIRAKLIEMGWTPPGQGQPSAEPVAWMTHHDEPMLFPSKSEAATYCGDGEEPAALVRLSDYEALQAECGKLREALELARADLQEWLKSFPNASREPTVKNIERIDDAIAAHRKGGEV